MEKGIILSCKITGIQSYGVFVEYEDYQGLIHISEVSDRFVADINKLFNVGDFVNAKVIDFDDATKKLQLSYKQAQQVNQRVSQQVDIKIGFRSIEKKRNEWINQKKEEIK
ncbi:S1 RNA-binding domain-containing protein [Acholeplasma hippikon]|nr:S1 RNA-binding domain-containing protein [Acholeplasma hippikon]